MHKHINRLVNAQVEVNRAVWAANLGKADIGNITKSSFDNEKQRDEYLVQAAKCAIEDLQAFLKACSTTARPPNHQSPMTH